MKKIYKNIFFDLDHTLWDFERNSSESLREMYLKYDLLGLGIENAEHFEKVYKKINYSYWEAYRKEEINKDQLRVGRFRDTFTFFDIDNNALADRLGDDYLSITPYKKHLFPDTIEILDKLKEKYRLHIITNGFEEVQYIKMKSSGLTPYFENIITSEQAKVKKPNPIIFEYALKTCKASVEDSLMIGDNPEVDCKGAYDIGMDSVYFNPNKEKTDFPSTYEINGLNALERILL